MANLFGGHSDIVPGSVRLVVNGRSVTARAAIAEGTIAYNPEEPFAPGAVRVEVRARCRRQRYAPHLGVHGSLPAVPLRGTARPGERVLGRLVLQPSAPRDEAVTLGKFLAAVTPAGTWSLTVPHVVAPDEGTLALVMVAIDRLGHRSPPVVIPVGERP
jgi:hypothetical protein